MTNRLPNTIAELTSRYRTLKLDPVDVIDTCLNRAINLKNLNAFITLTSDVARKKSQESSLRYKTGTQLSDIDGVPIAIKDNFCTKNIRTTCASKMLENFIPTYNATVYDRLEKLGAILIGKTNLDEFAMGSGTIDSHFGPTKNIWSKEFINNNWNIVGGSSGGSSVSVASGISYAALGSDTGGSTRNPASYCGVVGLKPTYGLLSRHGLIPLVNSMDVPGILTQNVSDCSMILNYLAGPDQSDSTTIKKPFKKFCLTDDNNINVENIKIGIPKEYHVTGLSSETLNAWIKIADLLSTVGGADVEQISLPNTLASIYVYTILNQCEVASNMARYDGIEYGYRSKENYSTEQLYAKTREYGFNNVVKNRILTGNYFLLRKNYNRYFEKALKVRRLILNDFRNVLNPYNNSNCSNESADRVNGRKVDVILTPTTLTVAPIYKDFIQYNNRDQCAVQDVCTQAANMAGIPAVSIPIELSSNGLPISLQLMSSHLSEEILLKVAKWIELQVNFQMVSDEQYTYVTKQS